MTDLPKFATKKELFDYLIANKTELISLKKSIVKHTSGIVYTEKTDDSVNKIITDFSTDNLAQGIIKRTIIANTYGWMDNHDDVHIKGVFTKSIGENKNIFHLHDHIYELTAKVGTPLKIYEGSIKWEYLGVSKSGNATCLLMDSEIKRSYNPMIFDEYYNNQINQHSVGMIYVKLFLCVNDSEYKEEYANWTTYFPQVVNSEKATENGYFWAVTEAKLREISCVISGSNELTPTINGKEKPEQSTKINEPVITTQPKTINYNYLLKNLK